MTQNQISHAAQVADQQHMERSDTENKRHNERAEYLTSEQNRIQEEYNKWYAKYNQEKLDWDKKYNSAYLAWQVASGAQKLYNEMEMNSINRQRSNWERDARITSLYYTQQQVENERKAQDEIARHNLEMESIQRRANNLNALLENKRIEYQNQYWNSLISNENRKLNMTGWYNQKDIDLRFGNQLMEQMKANSLISYQGAQTSMIQWERQMAPASWVYNTTFSGIKALSGLMNSTQGLSFGGLFSFLP